MKIVTFWNKKEKIKRWLSRKKDLEVINVKLEESWNRRRRTSKSDKI